MIRIPRSALVAYGLAIVAVVVATLTRQSLDPLLGDKVPFATYYPAVAAIAFLGHLGAALFTTALSAVAGTYYFVEPKSSLAIMTTYDAIAVLLFVVTGGMVALLTDRLNKTRLHVQAALDTAEDQRHLVQQERTRLQELIDSIPGVVWETWGTPGSPEMRVAYVSDYIERMFGYSVREWRSKPDFWLQMLPPQDRAEVARVAAEKFAAGESGEEELRLIAKDGRIRWVLTRFDVIKDRSGKPVGMRGVAYDITTRKDTERRLKTLADISGSGLSGLSTGQLASHVATRLARIIGEGAIVRIVDGDDLKAVGYDHQSTDARPLARAFAEDGHSISRSPIFGDVAENPRTIVLDRIPESAYALKDRRDLDPLLERFTPRTGLVSPMLSNGRLFGTLALWRSTPLPYSASDVKLVEAIASRAALALENTRLLESLQREAEVAQRARAVAEEASRVKDEFLATLSHELRTPLNAIVGWAHMLRDAGLPEERRQAAVETIVRNAQSQEQLIADILDVQRIMAGKLRLTLRNVDLGHVVRAASETVRPTADAKQIRLQLLLDLDVSPIWGDAERLQQVVWNLLSNAIKFTPKGGKVQVHLLRGEDHSELVVEDNGPGIAPEFLPFVFDRFRQADSSTTRTHKGLGLGLAIVRSLVEMHGGTITAGNASEPGRTGGVFTIRLPCQAARTPAAIPPDLTTPVTDDETPVWLGEAPTLQGIRVLVVDDDPDARELIGAILERCGADVAIVGSVEEGLTALDTRTPHVVISDIEMPQEDGYSFIRRLRELPADGGGNLPAAALTAYASTADRMKVLAAGFNMHIAKPVQPAELAMIVASLAGRRP